MKLSLIPTLFLITLFTLCSCSPDEVSIGDKFLLYKEDTPYFNSIGLDVGGTQGLIHGKIESYGYDSTFVVAKMESGFYYFFEKSRVKTSRRPTREVEGPLGSEEFKKKATDLNLPSLSHFPPKG